MTKVFPFARIVTPGFFGAVTLSVCLHAQNICTAEGSGAGGKPPTSEAGQAREALVLQRQSAAAQVHRISTRTCLYCWIMAIRAGG